MSIPRTKILPVITVPTGGWDFKFYVSDAFQYDTDYTVTVSAGDYFMAGDNQSDCFLFELVTRMQAAIDGGIGGNREIIAGLDSDSHKVNLLFDGAGFQNATKRDIKLAWSESDSGIMEVLGFSTTDDTSTGVNNPVFTADWHHGYGFYLDEDGQCRDVRAVDTPIASTVQGINPMTGNVKTAYFGERFKNALVLQHIERYHSGRTKVFSDGVGYGSAPANPYNRNEPLECWWQEAKKGKRFRVYRDGFADTARASGTGTASAVAATTVTDASKSFPVEPYRWVGALIYTPTFGAYVQIEQGWYIESHTDTVLTVPNAHPTGYDVLRTAIAYYLLDHQYETYVVDLGSMGEFKPQEIPNIDRYNITIPLLRYVA